MSNVTITLAHPLRVGFAYELQATNVRDYESGEEITIPHAQILRLVSAGMVSGVDPNNAAEVAALLGALPSPEPIHLTYGGVTIPTRLAHDGDLYLQSNGNLYRQVAGGWVLTVTLGGGGGGTGVPATTVTDQTTFGLPPAVGAGTGYAREDHSHGSPALGTSGTTAAAGNDSRLTNARTPLAHASSHASGGGDPVTPAAIGADVAGAASSAVGTHTGTADPHGDRAFATQRANHTGTQLASTVSNFDTAVAATALLKANNLADVAIPATARTNLGLGSAAVAAIDATATDIQPLGVQAAGATGKVADGGHVHPMPRLDQVSAPTAAVPLGGQKITGLANGSTATDAAAFGQIPAALPPNGAASGDLGGTYPAPQVVVTHLAAPLPIAQGGTAAATPAAALTALGAPPATRTITAGTGLTGGGDLSANRTLAVSYGTAAGTAAQGNDPRIGMLFPFSRAGALTVASGTFRLYNDSGGTLTIKAVRASVGTAPTGAAIICDVKKNGTTIFTTTGNRPTIAAAASTSGKVTNMDITTLADGDYLTVDIAQIGATVAGSDLVVQVTC